MRASWVLAVVLAIVAVFWGFGVSAEGTAPSQKDIEASLICQCGCTMVVVDCTCDLAEQMRADIAQKIKSGMTKEEILASYVKVYGKKVLAAPPKEGFDWTAWIIPFVAVGAGAVLVYFLLRRWVGAFRRTVVRVREQTMIAPKERAKYEAKIEEELRKYF